MEALALSLLFGAAIVFGLYKYIWSKHKRLPPGPRGLSALLSVLKAFRDGSLHKQAKVWHQQYGDLVLCRTVLGDLCFLNSARLVRDMFASKERELVTNDRPQMFTGRFVLGQKDVLTADPHLWSDWPKIRRLFHQAIKFYGDGVERFESTVQTELRRLTSRIQARAGEEVDMDSLLSYSVASVLHVMLTGGCPEPDSEGVQLIKHFDRDILDMLDPAVETVLATFPFLRLVPGTYYRALYQRVDQQKNRIIAEFFTKAKATHTPGCPRGIIDVLLDEQLKGDNHWLTDDVVQGLVIDIFGAGFSTSYSSLKVLYLLLVHHPEVVQKIQKEIDDVMGDNPPCVKSRADLPYTEAVVMETFRFASNLPFTAPHTNREDVNLDGLVIPKGSTIFANMWTFHRDPEVYPDPELFLPERFLDDVTGQLLPTTHPVRQGLLPFGVGRRSCPGENFARTRIFLYVTTLLQQFDILPPVKHQLPPPDPELFSGGVVLEPKSYHLIFRKRS